MNIGWQRSFRPPLFWLTRRYFRVLLFSLIAAQAQAVTNVSGSISVNTIWSPAAGPYVIGGIVQANPGVTLTIEPGTVVKGSGSYSNLYVKGTLRAQGTTAAPIIFTSAKDDSVGGDSNELQSRIQVDVKSQIRE